MPVGLAFKSFFRLLFGKKLPPEAAAFLPDDAIKALLPASTTKVDRPVEKVADKPAAAPPQKPLKEAHRDGALAMLALLQREGRLIDFLREPLDGFSDGDIGAAARDVHRGCK